MSWYDEITGPEPSLNTEETS